MNGCEMMDSNTPYSKMATILVFFCFHANWPLWPRSKLNIPLNFTFESEAVRANLHGNKRILKWRPFWNKVYGNPQSVEKRLSQKRGRRKRLPTNLLLYREFK